MPPKITLYGSRTTPFVEKCRRGLVLKGLPFEIREPSGPEDYRRWSPETGLLPVMTVDDRLVSDSTAILLELDRIQPDPPLLSTDPVVAAQQRSLEDWADESFLWHFQQWLRLTGGSEAQPVVRPRSSALRRLAAWVRAGGTWERPQTAVLRAMDDRLGDLVNFLGSRSFFYSDAVSMADLAIYGMLFTLRNDSITGAARLLATRPQLLEFMRRVEAATGG